METKSARKRDPAEWHFAQFHLPRNVYEQLRAKFPGLRDGVRWTDVAKAALACPSRW